MSTGQVQDSLKQLREQYKASAAKVETADYGDGRMYCGNPQQRSAAQRAFNRMLDAYARAGLTQGQMMKDLEGTC